MRSHFVFWDLVNKSRIGFGHKTLSLTLKAAVMDVQNCLALDRIKSLEANGLNLWPRLFEGWIALSAG